MRHDCYICRAEGFEAQTRIQVTLAERIVIATLNIVVSDLLLPDEVSLSEFAWNILKANQGDLVTLSHPGPLESASYIRKKIYGNELNEEQINSIVQDISEGSLSDIHLSAFITATVKGRLNNKEIKQLTKSMVKSGDQLKWSSSQFIVDKHCVGGLPGNRTSLIIVPIIAAYGLMIPKTSSRAITSPSGTADTMEVFAPVELNLKQVQHVVEKENGCIVWGGSIDLSPVDDILIRVERVLNLDSEGQLVASILSKKIAAGSTHVIIDIPIGKTAKVRNEDAAILLKQCLEQVGKELNIIIRTIFTDGSQPVGRGIGPCLEARDVLNVLLNTNVPLDLRERALILAGNVLEFSSDIKAGTGKKIAQDILDSGKAWKKFQAICDAQGGMRELFFAKYTHEITARKSGKIVSIDNRILARVAKLAGAPQAKSSGLELQVALGSIVEKNQPLFTIHAETSAELAYTINYLENKKIFTFDEEVF